MVEIKKVVIERQKSEKTKNEFNVLNFYYAVDGGAVECQAITFDKNVMLVLADLSPSAFDRKLAKVGDTINIKLADNK